MRYDRVKATSGLMSQGSYGENAKGRNRDAKISLMRMKTCLFKKGSFFLSTSPRNFIDGGCHHVSPELDAHQLAFNRRRLLIKLDGIEGSP